MKKRLDRDMIISLAVVSLLSSTAVVFFLLFLFDIQISQANLAGVIGSYSGLSSSIWLILLCRNC
ncbi:hypothetical protein SAMN04487830_1565 [Pseudobutyrivibrio sp. OR37]|uniref:hypothetical protein n=1 Tax=Pseudobutyrivibrio sp. OR37 TaxID=1798186 RepID=UPI0008E5A03A|nr:hypothetical protein [Pseudobutyrivibrio sp. OR37]SFI39262.1 hypothetical protein SAMN04487830_1565 [Pseudobutyrivibrio sp. OR37]